MTGFTRATKEQSRLRIALGGVSGGGKTLTAMIMAKVFSQGKPFAVVDTERGSAAKYADRFEFDVLELNDFHPDRYIEALQDAENAGYSVIILDSITHEWNGHNGILELVDRESKRNPRGDSFAAWKVVTPLHNKFIDAMLRVNAHLIVTMRTKTDYAVTSENGKTKVQKLGMAPVQREGMEYEFDIWGDMDTSNNLIVAKTRFDGINGEVVNKPGPEFAQRIYDWATSGAVPSPLPRALLSAWQTLKSDGIAKGIDIPDPDETKSIDQLRGEFAIWRDQVDTTPL